MNDDKIAEKLNKINALYKQTDMPFVDLNTTNDKWNTLLTNCLQDNELFKAKILLDLAFAGIQNRYDWSEGFSIVEDTFYAYVNDYKEHFPEVYNEYLDTLDNDNDDADGRIFRDLQFNFNELISMAQFNISIAKVDQKTVKALTKLFSASNVKFLAQLELNELL